MSEKYSADLVLTQTFTAAQQMLAGAGQLAPGAFVYAGRQRVVSIMTTGGDDPEMWLAAARIAVIALDAVACGAYMVKNSPGQGEALLCLAESGSERTSCFGRIMRSAAGRPWILDVSCPALPDAGKAFPRLLPPGPVTAAQRRKAIDAFDGLDLVLHEMRLGLTRSEPMQRQ